LFSVAEERAAIFQLEWVKFIAFVAITAVVAGAWAQSANVQPESAPSATAQAPMDQLIPWLLDEDQQLRGVPFSEVTFDTTGKKVVPFDARNAVDQRVSKAISAACDEAMERLNAPDSAIQNVD
jgi:hypothetical protein